MAAIAETADVQSSPGPLVQGKETRVYVYSLSQLEQSPFLPSLVSTINEAYAENRESLPSESAPVPRLNNIEEFFSNIRGDPQAFTIIISYPQSDQVLATATARGYYGPKEGPVVSPWIRISDVEDGVEEWELKLMATTPAAQGCGLATYMMDLVEKTIISRTRIANSALIGSQPKRLKMVLCTPLELTGPFYTRKGYTEDYRVPRGEGYNFHIVFLSKEIVFLA